MVAYFDEGAKLNFLKSRSNVKYKNCAKTIMNMGY